MHTEGSARDSSAVACHTQYRDHLPDLASPSGTETPSMYPKVCSSGHQYPTVSSNDEYSLAKELLAGNPFYPVALPVSIHSVQLALRYQWCSLAKGYQNSLYVFDLPDYYYLSKKSWAESWASGREVGHALTHLHTSLLDGICKLRISRS